MTLLRNILTLLVVVLIAAANTATGRPQIPAFITRWWHGPGWVNPAKQCARYSGQTLREGPVTIEARLETFRNPAGKDYDDSTCDNNAVSWAIEALNTDDCDTRVYMYIDTEEPTAQWPAYDADWKMVLDEWDDGNNIYYGKASPHVGDPMHIETVDKDVDSYTLANIRVKLTDVDDWTFENVINKFNCYFDGPPAEAECLAKWRSVKCCTAMPDMDDDVIHALTVSVRAYKTGQDHLYCSMNPTGRSPGNVDFGGRATPPPSAYAPMEPRRRPPPPAQQQPRSRATTTTTPRPAVVRATDAYGTTDEMLTPEDINPSEQNNYMRQQQPLAGGRARFADRGLWSEVDRVRQADNGDAANLRRREDP